MKPPARFLNTQEALPLVDDAAFLARVEWLAGQMGLRPPPVRLVRSVGGEQSALALAGGLVAPSLVVMDGILHRLSSDERDAIIGHELAHIANRSLWFLTSAWPLAATASVLMAIFVPPQVAITFALLMYVGVQRMVSRNFEYDCDRRAANVIGFRTMISALGKIHAAHLLCNEGWLSALVYAIATHPSRDERLAALYDAAPPDDRPEPTWSADDVRWRHRWARMAGLACLSGLLVFPLWYVFAPSWVPVAGLLVLGLAPWMLLLVASLRATRFERRRRRAPSRSRWRWATLGTMLSIVALGTLWGSGSAMDVVIESRLGLPADIVRAAASLALLVVMLLLLRPWRDRSQRLQRDVDLAVQRHDFAEVVRLWKESPDKFAKAPALRHAAAVSLALTGKREEAVDQLRQLVEDEPRFPLPRISLTMILCDQGEYAAALAANEPLLDLLPRDPAPVRQQAWCLRLVGRLDEAEEAVQRSLALEADSGRAEAIAAAIAIDRGDLARAGELLDVAERHDPGTSFVETIKAELALARGDETAARTQLERAADVCRANPFAMLDQYLAGLRARAPQQQELVVDPP